MAAIIEKLSDSRAEAREWELRCDMAAVFRIGARLGWNEHNGNHNSPISFSYNPVTPPPNKEG